LIDQRGDVALEKAALTTSDARAYDPPCSLESL
jgi:hypothetical protein